MLVFETILMREIFSEGTTIKFYRWTDPVMGPRKMPDMKNPLAELTEISSAEKFSINVENQTVKVGEVPIQSGLVFRVSADA